MMWNFDSFLRIKTKPRIVFYRNDQRRSPAPGGARVPNAEPPRLSNSALRNNVGMLAQRPDEASYVWDPSVEAGGLLHDGRLRVQRSISLLRPSPPSGIPSFAEAPSVTFAEPPPAAPQPRVSSPTPAPPLPAVVDEWPLSWVALARFCRTLAGLARRECRGKVGKKKRTGRGGLSKARPVVQLLDCPTVDTSTFRNVSQESVVPVVWGGSEDARWTLTSPFLLFSDWIVHRRRRRRHKA